MEKTPAATDDQTRGLDIIELDYLERIEQRIRDLDQELRGYRAERQRLLTRARIRRMRGQAS